MENDKISCKESRYYGFKIMANLFFIYSPMQLLVAQQIINMKKLSDNIMLYGYIGGNYHFLIIYELTCVNELWKEKVMLPGLAQWAAISRRNIYKDLVKTYHNYIFIKRLIKEYNIGSIYLGDINNYSNKFANIVFKKGNVDMIFYEEGLSHYAFQDHFRNKKKHISDYLLCPLLDFFYFWPLYKVTYAKYCFKVDRRFEELHIDKRYSIRPFYHESYDETITVSPLISDRLSAHIENEIAGNTYDNAVLLMTSPAYELLEYNDIDNYLKVLEDYVSTVDVDTMIYVKFHPREVGKAQEDVLNIIKKNHPVLILGNEVNIPVEYYLQTMKFVEVTTFFSSTAFYNGLLFPQVRFVSLLQHYVDKCCSSGNNRLRGEFADRVQVEKEFMRDQKGWYFSFPNAN